MFAIRGYPPNIAVERAAPRKLSPEEAHPKSFEGAQPENESFRPKARPVQDRLPLALPPAAGRRSAPGRRIRPGAQHSSNRGGLAGITCTCSSGSANAAAKPATAVTGVPEWRGGPATVNAEDGEHAGSAGESRTAAYSPASCLIFAPSARVLSPRRLLPGRPLSLPPKIVLTTRHLYSWVSHRCWPRRRTLTRNWARACRASGDITGVGSLTRRMAITWSFSLFLPFFMRTSVTTPWARATF